MSTQSALALPCPGCNIPIYYLAYHIPHCKNPNQSSIITLHKQGHKVKHDS